MTTKSLKISLITLVVLFALMLGAMAKAEQGRAHSAELRKEIVWMETHSPIR